MRGVRKEVKRRDVKRRERKQERVKLGGWGRIKEGDCGFGEERERTLEERE
jgi:hypothetical protein